MEKLGHDPGIDSHSPGRSGDATSVANTLDTLSAIDSAITSYVFTEQGRATDSNIPIKEEHEDQVGVVKSLKCQVDPKAELGGFFPNLQRAIILDDVDTLTRHQSTGAGVLGEFVEIMSATTTSIPLARIESIKTLKEKTNTPKTIIGVVGATGHGKSSLINALLEEENLVPTSCFRACTAVVTEISFNFSNDSTHPYTAEIEFIAAEDWSCELGHIFQDLATSSAGISSVKSVKDPDAAIAWAKVQAVYPELKQVDLRNFDAKTLANDPNIKVLLGTTKTVQGRTAKELYRGIRRYIDSKGKSNFGDSEGKQGPTTQKMEFWPLIKVVRIYTKADILSSGAVFVDLPRTVDSNPARAAVAGKYIEKCDAIWVTSTITRAVDDQAAQELLGAKFKRQLQLDGNYFNITFICTKTDDINYSEAVNSLGLDSEQEVFDDAKHNLSSWEAISKLEKLKKRKESITMFIEEINKHICRYEKLRNDRAHGKSITPPKEYPKKSNICAHVSKLSKRRKVNSNEGSQDTQWISAEDHWKDFEAGMPKFSEDQSLEEEDTQLMIEYLISQKGKAIKAREDVQHDIDCDENHREALEEEVWDREQEFKLACISKRNDCSRYTIRDQFALGLKELDQQEAEDNDPENFDPENEIRDYAEIGRSLPVFCVSSQAYRSLALNESVDGFTNMEDTEIPQLRAHAKMLTEAARIRSAKSFLNDFMQSLNSLYLWSSGRNMEHCITADDKQSEMEYITEKINELKKRLGVANGDLGPQLNEILGYLFRHIEIAADNAAQRAPGVAHTWPSRSRGDGGLPCRSYQAVLRREGEWSGTHGPRDFNGDLAAPLLQKIGKTWEITFTKRIPEYLDRHAKACQLHQEIIQTLVTSHLQSKAAFNSVVRMLREQDKARISGLTAKIKSVISDIQASQRKAHRCFAVGIQRKLIPKYKECSLDKGPGVFARIRTILEDEIEGNGRAIFRASYGQPKKILSGMVDDIQKDLQNFMDLMADVMISDYRAVILGVESYDDTKIVRERVFELLKEVDKRFQ
ncbi:hypothetical protein F4777DRAFT_574412 [Nemania sp. FL0916]|nr:hypothetical protein F4777DRAFT_574412 [Nemania sp. FL0916]